MMISYLLLVFTSWWRLIDYQDLRFTRPVPTIHSRTAPYRTVYLTPTVFLVAANGIYDLLHSSPTLVKAYNALTVIYTIFTLSLPWSLFRCMYVRTLMRLNISNPPPIIITSFVSLLSHGWLLLILCIFLSTPPHRDWVIAVTDAGQASHFHMVRMLLKSQCILVCNISIFIWILPYLPF